MKDDGPVLLFRVPVFVAAGVAGGLAEAVWVSLYSSLTGVSAVAVAREVAASVFPQVALQPTAPLLGLIIHFALSLALGLAIGLGLRFAGRRRDFATTLAMLIGALTVVWGVNFLAILPLLNPRLAAMMPYSVTLFSKVLFAIAMACVLQLAQVPTAKTFTDWVPRLKLF
jgi:hypothetical protein